MFGAPLPSQTWLNRPNQTIWNAVAGGTLIGAPIPTPVCELPRDAEQEELYEFGRWARAALPMGSGHKTFHITSFYGPPKGDLMRNNYADSLLKLLFECSRDFGSQLPAAICCDLNRDPNECAYMEMALARTGWTDFGQIGIGENAATPHSIILGAAHTEMSGHGCTRIDLVLVNTVALAAFTKHN